jgi:protein-disulfide isomerase-like protein with CxxC motif
MTCEVRVAGPLASGVGEALRSRFAADWRRVDDVTVLTFADVDQSAVRAAMGLLWDSGHTVLAMATASE